MDVLNKVFRHFVRGNKDLHIPLTEVSGIFA